MTKNQGTRPRVPPSDIPIIGEKAQIREIIEAIVAQLKPGIDIILTNVEALEHRMNVVEEVKQVFPAHVTVTVKHDHGEGAKELVKKVIEDPRVMSIKEKK